MEAMGVLKALGTFGLGLGLIYLLLGYAGPGETWEVVKKVEPSWLALAAAAFTISVLARALRWDLLLRPMEYRGGVRGLLDIYMVGLFLSYVLPARVGDLARPYMAGRRFDLPLGKALASVALERVFDLLAVALAVLLALAYLPGAMEAAWVLRGVAVLVLMVVLTTLVLLVSYRYEARLTTLVVWIASIVQRGYVTALGSRSSALLRSFNRGLREVVIAKGSMAPITAISLLVWGAELAASYLVLLSLGVTAQIPAFILAVSIGIAFATLPLTPGGLGSYELGVTAVLTMGGVPGASALAFSLTDHLFKYVYVLIFGSVPTFRSWGRAVVGLEGNQPAGDGGMRPADGDPFQGEGSGRG